MQSVQDIKYHTLANRDVGDGELYIVVIVREITSSTIFALLAELKYFNERKKNRILRV